MKNSIEIKSTTTPEIFEIQRHFACKTPSIVYYITCKKCNIQYVGQTDNTIKERLYGHLAGIRAKNTFKPNARHFGTEHDVTNITITIIQNKERNLNKMLRTEELWRKKLNSKTPDGLNFI
jgi:predicted GIY-YIG superfamily endonuclease